MTMPVKTKDAETWVLVATIVASAMSFISTSVLNIALPSIQNDLNATGTQILWIVNGGRCCCPP